MKTDPHPDRIEFEFDREQMRRYLRLSHLVNWLLVMSIIPCVILIFCLMLVCIPPWEFSMGKLLAALEIAGYFFRQFMILGLIGFLACSYWPAELKANSLRLRVEGAFLRISWRGAFEQTDLKIHFRAVTDYSILDGPILRHCGLKTLAMSTTAKNRPRLLVTAIKDCEQVRDLLAQIDAAREGPSEHGRAGGSGHPNQGPSSSC